MKTGADDSPGLDSLRKGLLQANGLQRLDMPLCRRWRPFSIWNTKCYYQKNGEELHVAHFGKQLVQQAADCTNNGLST